jgi:hypothetical protein
MVRPGDYVRTEYQCRAAEEAPCRTVCKTCIVDEAREQCDCEYLDQPREPILIHGEPCHYVAWFENDAPEECYNGEESPVRGPDWQPITPEWNGDAYEWDYAL